MKGLEHTLQVEMNDLWNGFALCWEATVVRERNDGH